MNNIKNISVIVLGLFFCHCNNQNQDELPADYQKIKIDCKLIRYDQEVFNGNIKNISAKIDTLNKNYPGFTALYFNNLIGIPANNTEAVFKQFLESYSPIAIDVNKNFKNFDAYYYKFIEGFKRLHYFFPNYKIPPAIYSFIAPFHSFSNFISDDGLGIGLQLYLGNDYVYYNVKEMETVFPQYLIRKFKPEYIVSDGMQNIIGDICTDQLRSNTLLLQMVDLGKKKFILKKTLPQTPDSIIFGYTQNHLSNLQRDIKNVWGYIIQNNFLYSNDPIIIRDFIGEGPYCTTISKNLPANIGAYFGYLIVKKWYEQSPQQPFTNLLRIDNQTLFNQAKFKP
ncbi:MAG: hypothetical protein ORN85_05005 [Sediminibacterium sp.]|nr:hypothetical protein [Sediminibacterium sp.]